ncbi:hypothetical protein [Pseudescherichia vulneris]|uniref:hypothetical protein n=1 Tax=Pseudescherichia vulneris TaxID=566 RepID=UPI0030181C7B
MNLQTKSLLLAAAFLSASVSAEQSNDWLLIGETTRNAYFAKNGTFKHSNGASSFVVQRTDKTRGISRYSKIAIKDTDCDNGYGVISFYTLQDAFEANGDYVANGDSLGSGVGDYICSVRAEMLKKGH